MPRTIQLAFERRDDVDVQHSFGADRCPRVIDITESPCERTDRLFQHDAIERGVGGVGGVP